MTTMSILRAKMKRNLSNEASMRRKMIIALAATAMLGAAAIADSAMARGGHGGGGGHGGHGGMGGMHGGMRGGMAVGMRGGSWGGARVGAWGGSRAFAHNRFVHNRFAFRHHRFHRSRFLFAASFGYPYYGDCFMVRRVWSPWGWTWRRIWVCG
jgi:hypothetical protein